MCLYSHNEQLCVFRRYSRYSTIHMFAHFSMCLYSQPQTVSWWTWRGNIDRIRFNEQLYVFRKYPRYSTIHVFTHFSMCLYSQPQTVSWWTWRGNIVLQISNMSQIISRKGNLIKYIVIYLWVFTIETWRVSIADSCTFHLNLTCCNATNHCPRSSRVHTRQGNVREI